MDATIEYCGRLYRGCRIMANPSAQPTPLVMARVSVAAADIPAHLDNTYGSTISRLSSERVPRATHLRSHRTA